MFYSSETGWFYSTEIHGENMPSDVVKIDDETHRALLTDQASGKVIVADENGFPFSSDPPELSHDALLGKERAWRDAQLASIVWLRERHRDQQEIGGETVLTGELFAALLVYMQALRDWPQSPDFPDIEHRPIAPDWIADQTE